MKKKILTLIICTLFFTTILSITGLASQERVINEKPTVYNTPPNPPIIDGPESGLIKTTYFYGFTVTDPDYDDKLLTLEIDWGDGLQSETCGCDVPWENGERVEVEHRWKDEGTYEITARLADVYNEWSEWSDPYVVSMPRSRTISHPILLRILQSFPFLSVLLNL